MFTGIIEELGLVSNVVKENNNVHISIECSFLNKLKINQSIAHNGACLSVAEINENTYVVTAIEETINKTNIGLLKTGDKVNLERCLAIDGRLDGHVVQGHVDTTGICTKIQEKKGSWLFTIDHAIDKDFITVSKGSISVNGVSLTVVDSFDDQFSLAIIPYTYEHTNFHNLKIGSRVNLEFDIIGKYIRKIYDKKQL